MPVYLPIPHAKPITTTILFLHIAFYANATNFLDYTLRNYNKRPIIPHEMLIKTICETAC